jgi:hypothetical protein
VRYSANRAVGNGRKVTVSNKNPFAYMTERDDFAIRSMAWW